ncbi:MAG: class I SAM-dependent methyltransferase [Pseudomonadota bacterium]
MPTETLERYHRDFSNVGGFMMPLAMATWDFLFTAQKSLGVTGGMLEIGVFEGKSGILSALYMSADEPSFFLDLYEVAAARTRILSVKPANTHFLLMKSVNALNDDALARMRGALRWVHIDGEHTGYATRADLDTASHLLSERGIICVDDFFSFKYPQLTAAVYQFLLARPFEYKMFLASGNKCYICRSSAFEAYDDYIRANAAQHMDLEVNNWTLARSSFVHDFGCFSIIPRNKERDFVGLDRDIDAQVF